MFGSGASSSVSGPRPDQTYTRTTVSGFLFVVLQLLLTVLWLLIIGRVLIGWMNPTYDGPIGRFLFETTEPLLAPIRRVIPSNGTVDFSPLVLLVVLGFLVQIVLFR